MTPFLEQVASHYLEAENLEDYGFVFPNRRSGQFFTQYLQQQLAASSSQPHLLPCVTTISDLVARLTGTVVATDIEMTFALYDAYCQALGDKAQEFDKFIYWAQLIISDFNDIDRSLADAHEIYSNLEDLHDLSSNHLSPEVKEKLRKIFGDSLCTAFFDTDADASLWRLYDKEQKADGTAADDSVKREFLSLWNALEVIYDNYHTALAGKGVISPGKQLRLAAEMPDIHPRHRRLVFVGFGVLSAAEVKLFDRFKRDGIADFWWDYAGVPAMLEKAPHDPAALLIDGYCKRFGAMPIEPIDNNGPRIKVVAVPSMVGQAKVAFDEVSLMTGDGQVPGIETAVVLPDENLLVPLLHSIHGNVPLLNVTLGYPLRSSGIVSLMHIVARLHHQASKERSGWTYYREDVNDILSHPLKKTYFPNETLALSAHLARTNRFRVPAAEFEAMSFSDLFVPAMDSDKGDNEADYLDHLLAFCTLLLNKMATAASASDDEDENDDADTAQEGVQVPLQQAFLHMYLDVLNQLKRVLADGRRPLQRSTVFYLIDRLSASAVVSFTGEPLQGLQVMGLLETRNLDFDNVVILSMNERIFPRRRSINSFIPNYMRRAHGMSTIEQQEAIVAFNFYRLLNRSRQVTLICDSSAQKMGTSEPSRYITQLEKVYGKRLHHVEMEPAIKTSAAIPIQVPNNTEAGIRQRYGGAPAPRGEAKYLSASAINKYINCPLMFYLHYIQGLNEDNEVGDFMDYGTFGNVVHDTLGECYDCEAVRRRHGLIDKEYIQAFKRDRLEAVVIRCIKKHFLHVAEDQLDSDVQPLRGEALMQVETISSYVNFVLDYDLQLIEEKGPFTIIECEAPHNINGLKVGTESFNFTYKPDRIDRLADGTLRIVDYKTGKDETTFSLSPGLIDLFDNTKPKRRKAILQLFLYCYAYMTEHPNVKSALPVIYKLASMKDSGVMMKSGGKGATAVQFEFSMENPVVKDFLDQMEVTLKTLYEGDFIQAPENSKSCNYCRFIDFCRRLPSKK